jgi:hypothetical protein
MPAPDNHDFSRSAGSEDEPSGGLNFGPASRLEPMPVFEEASPVTLTIEVLKENYDELLRIIEANEWSLDEGLTTVFLAGLGLQKGLVHLDEVNGMAARGDAHAGKRVDEIVQELAAYHSMYSVMKFKAFKLYKRNQVLEFNNSGLRAQEVMWNEWADRMRQERESLNVELARMRALLSEFKLDWDESGAPPLPPGAFASLRVQKMQSRAPAGEERPVPLLEAAQTEDRPSLRAWLRKHFRRLALF